MTVSVGEVCLLRLSNFSYLVRVESIEPGAYGEMCAYVSGVPFSPSRANVHRDGLARVRLSYLEPYPSHLLALGVANNGTVYDLTAPSGRAPKPLYKLMRQPPKPEPPPPPTSDSPWFDAPAPSNR